MITLRITLDASLLGETSGELGRKHNLIAIALAGHPLADPLLALLVLLKVSRFFFLLLLFFLLDRHWRYR
jgi:hypothetical protein